MEWSDNIKRPRVVDDSVPEIEMGPFAEKAMCLFGININMLRSIPMVTDGLKPVARRILYMTYTKHRGNKVKVSSAIGELQLIHPHGDQGAGDTYAGMAQTFANNVPLLSTEKTGNSGNITSGNDAAAPRYLEFMLSDFTLDVLFSEFDAEVNMTPSYDYNSNGIMEPITLPAKFPIVMLNGACGIGYTLSTDIHPYNLNEVADATIKLLKNPKADVKLIPDLPTGCDIIVRDESNFVMQSSFEIDHANYCIIIKNTPYQKYLDDIDKRLREVQMSNDPIKEIIAADEECDNIEKKFRYVIRCKPCNLYKVVDTLFKRVAGFRAAINSNNILVVDPSFSMKKYTPRQILCAWIKNRLTEKRAWYLRQLVKATSERNMLKGKIYMLSPEHLNTTIKTFRESTHGDEIVPNLVKVYKGEITSSQANYIADSKFKALTKEEHDKAVERLKVVESMITEYKTIVEDPVKIRDVIIDELRTIKAKYGTPRRSKIITIGGETDLPSVGVVQILTNGSVVFSETENPEHLSSDITAISDEEILAIDEFGQFLWIDTSKMEHDKEITLTSIGKNQMGKCVFVSQSRENDIVFLTNKGRIKYMPMDRIPSNASKKPLMPGMDEDERIVSVLEIHDTLDDILVYTSNGFGKRIQLSSLNRVLSVDANGQYILTDMEAAGMFVINSRKPLMLYVTKLGRVRLNQSKYLVSGKKFAEPKNIISLSAQDDLVAVFCVDKDQEVTLYHADGRVSTVNIDTLDVSTFSLPAVKPKHVPAVKVVRAVLK